MGGPTARATPMFKVRPTPLPMPQFHGHENIPTEALQLQDLITNMDTKVFSHLVQAWMDMPRSTRKNLSYNGALRSRQGDPVHYHCPVTCQNYFDPTNWIYENALKLLAPELTNFPWNAETRGDICESIMGFAFIAEHRPSTSTTAAISKVSDLIDMVSWLTFRLCQSVGYGQFLEWIKWIQDIAAYRNRTSSTSKEDPLDSLLDNPVGNVFNSPRDKSKGVLKAGPWLQIMD